MRESQLLHRQTYTVTSPQCEEKTCYGQEMKCVTAFVRLAGTVISMAIVIQSGLKCSSCWSLNVPRNRHTPLLPGNNESTCVTAFVRLAGTVISMAIVIQRG